jgi:hypothetical protein
MMLLNSRVFSTGVAFAVISALVAAASNVSAEEMPAPPKVSTFAPAADLANQADRYIKDLEAAVANEADYKDSAENVAKQSNTLVVIALALGLHDQSNKYQAKAGAVIKAAQAVAATKDYASAKKAVAALKAAAKGPDAVGEQLKWEKVAALPELMKQVPVINSKLKLNIKPAKFKKKAKDAAGHTAVIAAIAQGSMADTSATKNADQVKQWYGFSAAMRDHAGALNTAIHKGDEPAAAKAMEKLAQSCDNCHAVFHPETTK